MFNTELLTILVAMMSQIGYFIIPITRSEMLGPFDFQITSTASNLKNELEIMIFNSLSLIPILAF